MIHNAPIPAADIPSSTLTLVPLSQRQRDQIDRKHFYLLSKRIVDIVFAGIFILLILSWLLPLLALLIKLSSRGPVFFLQKRIGFGGKSFTCYKLRTMIVNNEADTRQASDSDDRVTRFGHFLRKTNMDEFPQFFNVLKGDMSIVGPRPHMYADCRLFTTLLPGYKFRNMVRPGITGLAQIKGYHGPTTTRNCILMRYHWDNYYIRNMGMGLDCRILLFTLLQHMAALLRYLSRILSMNKDTANEILPG
jgi:putative colanic acid biosynthesis UDP-glucose lipid carrier transferase